MKILPRYKFNIDTLAFELVKTNFSWRKGIFKIVIIGAISFFILGYFFVIIKLWSLNDYLTIAAIVGGIASVSGLFTFSSNRIRRSDIEEIGIEYFKQVIESADKLKEKENDLIKKEYQLSAKEKELEQLELQKIELEYIVRKASMSIFLHDQFERLESRILELIQDNKELSNLLGQRERIRGQLLQLEEEIKISDKTEIVQNIISMIHSTGDTPKKDKTISEFFIDLLKILTK